MHTPPIALTTITLSASLLLTMFLLGCGAERYDQRFQHNTKTLLTEQAQLNENLASDWSQRGIHFRVPAGFEEEPIPQDGLVGVRLPNRRDLALPGMLGVFTGEIGAITSDGDTLDVPARIAVLSNREFITSRGTQEGDTEEGDTEGYIDPDEFNEHVQGKLADAISGVPKMDSLVVGGRGFQPTLRYVHAKFQTRGSQGIPYEVSLYLHAQANSNVQVAVLVIVPSETAGNEPLDKRLPISLRTLRIDATAGGSASPSGAPAGPSF